MIEQNQFHNMGLETMNKRGLTPQEYAISQNENLTFEEKVEKLRAGAEILNKKLKIYIHNWRLLKQTRRFSKPYRKYL